MKRGDIFYANLDPVIGSEAAKNRLLIVSNNINNRTANVVTILPLTSNVRRIYPFELLQTNDSSLSKSKVQAQQVKTISKERISSKRISQLSQELMELIDSALKLHLQLD